MLLGPILDNEMTLDEQENEDENESERKSDGIQLELVKPPVLIPPKTF